MSAPSGATWPYGGWVCKCVCVCGGAKGAARHSRRQDTSSITTLSPPGEAAGCLHDGFWPVKDTQSLKKIKLN